MSKPNSVSDSPGPMLERSRQLLVEELNAHAELAGRSVFVPALPPSATFALVVRLGMVTLWADLVAAGHELPPALREMVLASYLNLEEMRFRRQSLERQSLERQ
jgi:hypothetical protein